MQTHALGKSGLSVSALGLGCMGMSEFYGVTDDKSSVATIHRALELGINFFDTADMYGSGKNEELLRTALGGRRDQAIIATKFGIVRSADPTFRGVSGRPDYVRSACDASLRRLGIDTIDLYYQHRVDPNVPIEETVGAMADLVQAGKVRYLGLSEASAKTIRRAHAVHPIAALQTEYSLFSREPENEILPTCRELGIGFVPYSPLGRGLLTPLVHETATLPEGDYRRKAPRFQSDNLVQNLSFIERLERFAHRKGCTLPQLALAWVLSKGSDIVPIPGTKKVVRLEENWRALQIRLTSADQSELEMIVRPGSVSGERHPPHAMTMIDNS